MARRYEEALHDGVEFRFADLNNPECFDADGTLTLRVMSHCGWIPAPEPDERSSPSG